MTLATKFMTLEGPFKMHRGGYLESPTLAYETWGELNEAKDNRRRRTPRHRGWTRRRAGGKT
jgi:hypothetical protein